MSHSLRFLGLAVFAWVGVRAASLGLVPGAEALAFDRPAPPLPTDTAALPAIVPTDLVPPQPLLPGGSPQDYYGAWPPAPFGQAYLHGPAQPLRIAVSAYPSPVPTAVTPGARDYLPMADAPSIAYLGGPVTPLDQWPLSNIVSTSAGRGKAAPASSIPAAPPKLDRLQLTAWAMVRGQPGGSSLASGGTLGGSQAGSRLTWHFNRRLAASLRMTAPIGGATRGGELAAGVRVTPFAAIPVALTAERRQAIGRYGGRSDFALFAEGGVWDRPVAAGFALDGYLQGGLVGRDWFVDGSAGLTRPLWRRVSAGAGLWAGAQPGLSRVDVGPRLTVRARRNLRLHLDYRHKLSGNALPGSGAVVTIAGDF